MQLFQPLYNDYPYYSGLPSAVAENLPVARKVSKEVLYLPLYGGLGADDFRRICEILITTEGEK